jgi:ferric-dicitrate binding protein FerR (iron transport regulator)
MDPSGGQLCARARLWASLRVDGELSELEGALLDGHLGRCAECATVVEGFETTTEALRSAPLTAHRPVVLPARRPSRRGLTALACAAFVVVAAVFGGLVRAHVSHDSVPAPRTVAVVASFDTPDQLRRLRRTTLLDQRRLPRDVAAEPV